MIKLSKISNEKNLNIRGELNPGHYWTLSNGNHSRMSCNGSGLFSAYFEDTPFFHCPQIGSKVTVFNMGCSGPALEELFLFASRAVNFKEVAYVILYARPNMQHSPNSFDKSQCSVAPSAYR